MIAMRRVSVLREGVATRLKRSEWLHQAVMRWKSRRTSSLLVVPGRTEVVVEAFPRSSNLFMVRMPKAANPGLADESICHHTHSIHSVKREVRAGVPVLMIIRNLADAIISLCIARSNFSPAFVSIAIPLWKTGLLRNCPFLEHRGQLLLDASRRKGA
jgi:hypothetical protein